jgi:hypothetical protein
MIVMVMFDKKYCNNNSNNRCTFIIELLHLSTSPDIIEEECETSAKAVVVPENTRIKTFLKKICSNKNSKRNTSIDAIQRELWALKKEKYQKQIEVLEIIRKKELEDLKGKEFDNLLKTKQLNLL